MQDSHSRSSHPEVLCRKGVLRNFAKFIEKHLCQSLFFNKAAGLRCFPVNFAEFQRTCFVTKHLRWLLLAYWTKSRSFYRILASTSFRKSSETLAPVCRFRKNLYRRKWSSKNRTGNNFFKKRNYINFESLEYLWRYILHWKVV